MTERVKRHPPAYRRKLNMAKRKNQKRRSKKYQVNNRQLKAKRMYKDTIFRMLYHNKENLLSLYNAVNGREYTDPEKLQVVTLENAIYMGMKNDLAFIMDMNLYLYEHQDRLEQLLDKVWGYEYYGDVRTVDVTVRRLREKIEDNPAEPVFILTKRGVGYYFNPQK